MTATIRPDRKVLRARDRELRIKCALDENSFQIRVVGPYTTFQVELTRGFARELRDFLTASDSGHTTFGDLT